MKNILFDLDGTLLPMDQDVFVKAYFSRLAKKLAPHGYQPEKLVETIWAGTAAMVKNDGSCMNEDAFWNYFAGVWGQQVLEDKPLFEEYYRNEFQQVQEYCGYNEAAAETVKQLKGMGYQLILATNPLFPAIATESRIRWAGLKPEDFVLYTTYENTGYCKPNPRYYQDILERLNLKPEECLMVGNDVTEDMVAQTLGMKVFLLTDCLINKKEEDIAKYPNGTFSDLMEYISVHFF